MDCGDDRYNERQEKFQNGGEFRNRAQITHDTLANLLDSTFRTLSLSFVRWTTGMSLCRLCRQY
jgi:hypothetical protein